MGVKIFFVPEEVSADWEMFTFNYLNFSILKKRVQNSIQFHLDFARIGKDLIRLGRFSMLHAKKLLGSRLYYYLS